MKPLSETPSQRTDFDCIVVGGGTAGCVVAARLSEDADQSVLLLEAGRDSDVNHPESPLRDASRLVLEEYNWDYAANVRPSGPGGHSAGSSNDAVSSPRKPFAYKLGKVLGGSSAVNGAVALRAFPSDFDHWATLGCPDWSWDAVLPWFRHLEGGADPGDVTQADSQGPVRLRRPSPDAIHPLDRAFTDACVEIGMPYLSDINDGEGEAVGPVPSNVGDGAERRDMYRCYLEPARTRSNLTILTDALTDTIEFRDQTAVAVWVIRDGQRQRQRLTARRIVLCAGAIGSPALLQRSGIGDPSLLESLGIPVIQARAGVGRNLMDHASLVIWATPTPGGDSTKLPWRQVAARTRSGVDEQVDVQLGLLNNVDRMTVPGFRDRVDSPMLVGGSVMLMRPMARGRVHITSREAQSLPDIDLPLTLHDDDIERMMGGVRKIWRLMTDAGVQRHLEDLHFWSAAMIDNDAVVRSAIRHLVNPGWHACGTTRMGRADDPDSVTGEDGRVHGVRGLWLADASLFPTIPSLPTNLTTVMAAERIAHAIKTED